MSAVRGGAPPLMILALVGVAADISLLCVSVVGAVGAGCLR